MSAIGRVLRARGGVYDVEVAGVVVAASLRGRLKRRERPGDRVVAGDHVDLRRDADDGEAWRIERVHERRTALVRRAPGKAPKPKPVAANVDRLFVVFAIRRPEPNLRMLDRFLVLAEAGGIEPVIVLNKVDLAEDWMLDAFAMYGATGYPVLHTSVPAGTGIDRLTGMLNGRISALAGPSGAGKSSLLNAVQPGLGLRIGEVGLKGRHTTVTAELIPLRGGGYVADTPGLREIGLWGVPTSDLANCFPEMRPWLGGCRYGHSCSHTHEPECAVLEALRRGDIHAARYQSYRRMLEEPYESPGRRGPSRRM